MWLSAHAVKHSDGTSATDDSVSLRAERGRSPIEQVIDDQKDKCEKEDQPGDGFDAKPRAGDANEAGHD